MARYAKGALGAFSGKLGNVVGSSWRSIDYLRSLPKPSKKPATEKQLAQRRRFALAVSFMQPIKDVLNIGYSDARLSKVTGYNRAVKGMLESGITGVYPDLEIDYPNLMISKGSLEGLAGLSFTETAPGEISVDWQPRTNSFNAFIDDDVLVLLHNKSRGTFNVFESATREDSSVPIEVPTEFSGEELVAWVFLVKRDGKSTSNSQYAGSLTVS